MLLGKYKIVGVLGKGTLGKEWLVDKDGVKYAIKQVGKFEVDDATLRGKSYLRLLNAMKASKGNHLVDFFGEEQDENNRFLVVEYIEDNLEKILKKKGNKMELGEAVNIIADVLRGLQELRMFGFNHLNLKPTNILVKKEAGKTVFMSGIQKVKLCDFEMYEEEEGAKSLQFINHLSPDFLQEKLRPEAADIWSVGVLLFYLLNGSFPFGNIRGNSDYKKFSPAEVSHQCERYSYKKQSKNDDYEDELENLFSKIFTVEAETRINPHKLKLILNELFPDTFSNKELQESKAIYSKEFVQAFQAPVNKPPKQPIISESLSEITSGIQFIPPPPPIIAATIQEKPIISTPSFQKQVREQPAKKVDPHPMIHSMRIKQPISQVPPPQRVEAPVRAPNPIQTVTDRRHNIFSFNHERNKFLMETSELALKSTKYFPEYLKYALAYLTLKLFIVYERDFRSRCLSRMLPEQAPTNLDWYGYLEGTQYRELLQEVDSLLAQATTSLKLLFDRCMDHSEKLESKIKNFKVALTQQVNETEFQGDWKMIYRTVTNLSYSALDRYYQKLTTNQPTEIVKLELGQVYGLLMKVFICHSINQMFRQKLIPELYKEYFDWKLKNGSEISELDFNSFRFWLANESIDNLQRVSERVKQKIFSNQESPVKQ